MIIHQAAFSWQKEGAAVLRIRKKQLLQKRQSGIEKNRKEIGKKNRKENVPAETITEETEGAAGNRIKIYIQREKIREEND